VIVEWNRVELRRCEEPNWQLDYLRLLIAVEQARNEKEQREHEG
jgi:hypothetical protein